MKYVALISIFLIAISATLPQNFLAYSSYWIYAAQSVTFAFYIAPKIKSINFFFLPSLFSLLYFELNLTLGGYLVPRGYGWDKQFQENVLGINSYHTIVPYLLICNLVLFVVTSISLRKLNIEQKFIRLKPEALAVYIPVEKSTHADHILSFLMIAAFSVFAALDYLDIDTFLTGWAFSFELAIMALHLTRANITRSKFRYLFYAVYAVLMSATDFDNKREIIMSVLMIIFLESYFSRKKVNLGIGGILGIGASFLVVFVLICVASIMRGYGDYHPANLLQAVMLVPKYLTSDGFIDFITDNLELNYSYGVALTAFNMVLEKHMDFQWGKELLKLVVFPIPRDIFPDKPMNVLQTFTLSYDPNYAEQEGSYPVMFLSEMFVNFHVAGALAVAAVFTGLDHIYIAWRRINKLSFLGLSYLFLIFTVPEFARGSGFDNYVFCYFAAAPFFFVAARALVKKTKRKSSGLQPTVVAGRLAIPGPLATGGLARPIVGSAAGRA
jgi:hypothetical protein